jgi:hypothetical protein
MAPDDPVAASIRFRRWKCGGVSLPNGEDISLRVRKDGIPTGSGNRCFRAHDARAHPLRFGKRRIR